MADVLELGCGLAPNPKATVHHNLTPVPGADVLHDLDVYPWPWADGAFDEIIAIDVFEHLRSEIPAWLAECHRILRPGGLLAIQVPDSRSWHAWADPTHRRGFSPITFDYLAPGTQWHTNYGAHYWPDGPWWAVVDRSTRQFEVLPMGTALDLQFLLKRLDAPAAQPAEGASDGSHSGPDSPTP